MSSVKMQNANLVNNPWLERMIFTHSGTEERWRVRVQGWRRIKRLSVAGVEVAGIWPERASAGDINCASLSNYGATLVTGDDQGFVKLFPFPCKQHQVRSYSLYRSGKQCNINFKNGKFAAKIVFSATLQPGKGAAELSVYTSTLERESSLSDGIESDGHLG